MSLVERVGPELVIDLHTPLDCVIAMSERAQPFAEHIAEPAGMPIVRKLEGPTPGDSATWCEAAGATAVTYEFELAPMPAIWARHAEALVRRGGMAPMSAPSAPRREMRTAVPRRPLPRTTSTMPAAARSRTMFDTVAGARWVLRAISAWVRVLPSRSCCSARTTRRWFAARSEAVDPGAGRAVVPSLRAAGMRELCSTAPEASRGDEKLVLSGKAGILAFKS